MNRKHRRHQTKVRPSTSADVLNGFLWPNHLHQTLRTRCSSLVERETHRYAKADINRERNHMASVQPCASYFTASCSATAAARRFAPSFRVQQINSAACCM